MAKQSPREQSATTLATVGSAIDEPASERAADVDDLTFDVPEAEPTAVAVAVSPLSLAPRTPIAAVIADPAPEPTAISGAPTWTYAGAATPVTAEPAADIAVGLQPAPISLGIVGRHRMPATVVALSILTLGFYQLVWYARINGEMSDFDTRMYVRSGPAVWAVAVPWLLGVLSTLAGLVWLLAKPLNVALPGWLPQAQAWALLPLAGVLLVPVLIVLLPFAIVGVAMTAERVRVCEDRVGLTADVQLRPVAPLRWLLVPAVGGLVVAAKLQIRLNRVWERVAPPASTRRRR